MYKMQKQENKCAKKKLERILPHPPLVKSVLIQLTWCQFTADWLTFFTEWGASLLISLWKKVERDKKENTEFSQTSVHHKNRRSMPSWQGSTIKSADEELTRGVGGGSS